MPLHPEEDQIPNKVAYICVTLARGVCAFYGFICLFAQLFFSDFDFALTVAGVSGLLAGILSANKLETAKLLVAICFSGILALGFDAYSYYSVDQVPGNSHAWDITTTHSLAFLVVGVRSLVRINSKAELKRPGSDL